MSYNDNVSEVSSVDGDKVISSLYESQCKVNGTSISQRQDNTFSCLPKSNQDAIRDRGHGSFRDGEIDVESAAATTQEKTSDEERDPNLVTWDSLIDPANPKNWTSRQKWAVTFLVSSYTFMSALTSSVVSPTMPSISKELSISNSTEQQMAISIFVLAYAIGPLFLGPFSEIYGRVPVLQLANIWFLAFNTGCGFAKTKVKLLAFRFLAGLGGSAPMAVGGGVLADVWPREKRGRAISIYTLMPLLGPAVGPITGGFIAQYSTWRWAFWSISTTNVFVSILGLCFLRETYAAVILQRKAVILYKSTGNASLYTPYDTRNTLKNKLGIALTRPFRLLLTQPIVQFLGVYMAFLYGLMYLVLSTFPRLWASHYRLTESIAVLHYIAAGLGFFIGVQTCAPLMDRIYSRLKSRAPSGLACPEFRVPLIVPGSVLVPVGVLLYGWAADHLSFWFWPDLGISVLSMGMIICFQCLQAYIVDTYTQYAASALAAATVMRSLAGFGFPLFAPAMYDALGYGWGNTILAGVGILLGCPAPFVLWKYGAKLRERSGYAAGEG